MSTELPDEMAPTLPRPAPPPTAHSGKVDPQDDIANSPKPQGLTPAQPAYEPPPSRPRQLPQPPLYRISTVSAVGSAFEFRWPIPWAATMRGRAGKDLVKEMPRPLLKS